MTSKPKTQIPIRNRLLTWLTLTAASSIILLWDNYASLLQFATNWGLLQSEGAYPLAMLLFLALFLHLKLDYIMGLLRLDAELKPSLSTHTITAALLVLASLGLKIFIQGHFLAGIIIILLYLQGLFTIAFPKTSNLTLKLLALYIASASLTPLTYNYLDQPVATAFTQASMPLVEALGYPITSKGQLLILTTSKAQTTHLYVNAACAGPASYSVFLFLAGLMYLDLNPGRKWMLLLTSTGMVALFLLNIVRLAALIHIAYVYSPAALSRVHSYLGYVIFLIFYIIFTYTFLRVVKRERAYSSLQPAS